MGCMTDPVVGPLQSPVQRRNSNSPQLLTHSWPSSPTWHDDMVSCGGCSKSWSCAYVTKQALHVLSVRITGTTGKLDNGPVFVALSCSDPAVFFSMLRGPAVASLSPASQRSSIVAVRNKTHRLGPPPRPRYVARYVVGSDRHHHRHHSALQVTTLRSGLCGVGDPLPVEKGSPCPRMLFQRSCDGLWDKVKAKPNINTIILVHLAGRFFMSAGAQVFKSELPNKYPGDATSADLHWCDDEPTLQRG
ncbi:uncharacterized protein F5Z01DRAFT_332139 [Emericellopsis atlantica]|uniref:Uncharacterized protein n=1 Tax=Emericellopsis atlantica TaxID=2614577 RepID=A0A9P7ZG48_9HYPO|nr:uncharacterized protein F5Z01DRAFT_332139 [Emericellopsis atlantica]KAG9250848.1 hypothetical protein F5Z01DRAFT_332139 [Emericellopsis atlantica]